LSEKTFIAFIKIYAKSLELTPHEIDKNVWIFKDKDNQEDFDI
jgi:hypothetical protein